MIASSCLSVVVFLVAWSAMADVAAAGQTSVRSRGLVRGREGMGNLALREGSLLRERECLHKLCMPSLLRIHVFIQGEGITLCFL